MAFLGKFFNKQGETPKDSDQKGEDGPPIPKRIDAASQAQPAKKKFEKPSVQKEQPAENQPEQEAQPSHYENHGQPEQETHNSIDTSMTVSEKKDPPPSSGKALSFLEKMKLKREQEEAANRSKLENSQMNDSRNEHQEENSNVGNVLAQVEQTQQEPPKSTAPKFQFLRKNQQPAPPPQEDVSQNHRYNELDNVHQEETPATNTSTGEAHQNSPPKEAPPVQSKLPFKFPFKKQTPAQAPASEDPQAEQPSAQLASPVTSGPSSKFGFLNKAKANQQAVQSVQQDHNHEPNENVNPQDDTLNLSLGARGYDNDLGDVLNRHDEDDQDETDDRKDNGLLNPPSESLHAGMKKPSPPPEKVKEENFDFEALEQGVMKSLSAVKTDYFNSILNQNKKKREIQEIEQQMKKSEQKRIQFLVEQDRAVADEDFDLAQALEGQLEQLKATVEQLKIAMADSAFEITELESETVQLSSLHLTTLKKTEASYQSLIRNIEAHRATLQSVSASRLGSQRVKLEDELQQHLLTRDHLQGSLKTVLEEAESLEKNMDRQCRDLLSEETKLKQQDSTLEAEIQELRKQLERKIAEQEKNKIELAGVRERIDAIRGKFSKQTEKVTKKKEGAEAEMKQNDNEVKNIEAKLDVVKKEEQLVQDKCEKLKAQAESVDSKKKGLGEEISKMEIELKNREKINSICNQWKEKFAEEDSQGKDLEEQRDRVLVQIKVIDIEIDSTEEKIKKIQEKLPGLEKDKKQASTARNFKEAGRLAGEIKEKEAEIETLSKSIAESKSKKTSLEASLPELERLANQQRSKYVELKKHYEIAQYHILEKKIQDLQSIKEFFDAQPQLADSSLTLKIATEIAYCQSSQHSISEKYGEAVHKLQDPSEATKDQDSHSAEHQEASQSAKEVSAAKVEENIEVLPSENVEESQPAPQQEEPVNIEQLQEELSKLEEEHAACEEEISKAAENEEYEKADELAGVNAQRMDRIHIIKGIISTHGANSAA